MFYFVQWIGLCPSSGKGLKVNGFVAAYLLSFVCLLLQIIVCNCLYGDRKYMKGAGL